MAKKVDTYLEEAVENIRKDREEEWIIRWGVECSLLERIRFFSFSNDKVCR